MQNLLFDLKESFNFPLTTLPRDLGKYPSDINKKILAFTLLNEALKAGNNVEKVDNMHYYWMKDIVCKNSKIINAWLGLNEEHLYYKNTENLTILFKKIFSGDIKK